MSPYPTIIYHHAVARAMAADNDTVAILAMADLSSSKGDYGRSLLLLRNALAQTDKSPSGDPKQRLEILMKLAEVNHITGQWVDALMYLDNAYLTASEKQIRGVMVEALLASGTILSKKGKWDIALKKFDQAIALIGSSGNRSFMARALVGKGVISWRRGMGSEAIQLARRAIPMVKAEDDADITGSAHALIATAAFDMGDYALSLEANEVALAHYTRSGNQMEMARVLNNAGETHKLMGDYSKALDFFTRGMTMAEAGSPRSAGYLLTNIAECHARQGRSKDARAFAHMAADKAAKVEDEYLHAMLEFAWGLIHESEDEPGKAEKSYLSAIGRMQALGIPFDTGLVQMAYGKYLAKQNKTDLAIKYLGDAKKSFEKAGSLRLGNLAEKDLALLKP